ncbi:glycosyltransferase, partial [Patescibacteria group bacterium]|nr:glycosyltransferase [Patescibacteria group bacterium]
MHDKIPCSVEIVTRNSGATLRRALESVKDFAEVLVVDGGSTDDTLAIAHEYGAKIILQDPAFLDGEGRIADFSGVRNQGLAAAREPWFFFLDSDEEAS